LAVTFRWHPFRNIERIGPKMAARAVLVADAASHVPAAEGADAVVSHRHDISGPDESLAMQRLAVFEVSRGSMPLKNSPAL
jgi:hypothetical protein